MKMMFCEIRFLDLRDHRRANPLSQASGRFDRSVQQASLIVIVLALNIPCGWAASEVGALPQVPSHPAGLYVIRPPDLVEVMQFGAVGDGVADDTLALQKALTLCSSKGLTCTLPKNKQFRVTSPLYFWGNSRLVGEDGSGAIVFDAPSNTYLFNIGISAPQKLESLFIGTISKITFKVISGDEGRILFFWRTKNAEISDNIFDVGVYSYSAISSGNDNDWVRNGFQNCVRENITIKANKILARATNLGSEGIGLGHFDGVLIESNEIVGVGDDPIGIHYSKNVKILRNTMKSTDGRLFVSNSRNVEIAYNKSERMPSFQNGHFYSGIALLYVGFESYVSTRYSAPTNFRVYGNQLYYPAGSIDVGAAIYLYGPRDVIVENNEILNDAVSDKVTALHLLPARFTDGWSDPDNLDPATVARVWSVTISGNRSVGAYPLRFTMSGNCVDYKSTVRIENNVGPKFDFYCDQVTVSNNRFVEER